MELARRSQEGARLGAWAAPSHPRTVCIIDPPNLASRRVAAKLGYREIGQAECKKTQVVVFEHLEAR